VRYYFLDTSAFLKAYIVEPGKRRIRGLVEGATADPPSFRVLVTDFTFLEAVSALLQKREQRQITSSVFVSVAAEIEQLLAGDSFPFSVVRVSSIAHVAPRIIRDHRLRAGDAVHLAAAAVTKASAGREDSLVFVTSDQHQERAATAEGLDVWNPAP
jgi:predicted nucleic acid-binding protein